MNIEAQQAIESLRLGIPPEGHVRYFTVGRFKEINTLTTTLQQPSSTALLLKANYGSGKSHLLKFIRETALKEGYAVSSVTLDAKSAVRFNRMDQIFGAICRGLEVPGVKQKGIASFFDWISSQSKKGQVASNWSQITNNNRWNYSRIIKSPSIFIALRAWVSGRANTNLIEDWLHQAGGYKATDLDRELIRKTQISFREELQVNGSLKWSSYTTKASLFNFKRDAYVQSWHVIQDLDTLARASKLRGLIILFDEFEDIVYNISNIEHQKVAFQNLFQFFFGNFFTGMSFFAITPGFVEKCKHRLMTKGCWDYDYSHFDALPTFEMSPLEESHLQELAEKIRQFHGIAYDLDTNTLTVEKSLKRIVVKAASTPLQDRTRYTICEVVKCLDQLLEDDEYS
ncbi:BREX system ATP-binding domain-containing protein [Egbenema bharatensis]|uniref:BREX system ATP-binding domain-containing protein n=1 Tax=Egbenema bharatensis TaxID=3463334 RepID=UPI003A8C1F0A